MPYKDTDKAKVAARERKRRQRQGVTLGVTLEGVTSVEGPENVTPLSRLDFIRQQLGDPRLCSEIDRLGVTYNNLDDRYERAYRYRQAIGRTPPATSRAWHDRPPYFRHTDGHWLSLDQVLQAAARSR